MPQQNAQLEPRTLPASAVLHEHVRRFGEGERKRLASVGVAERELRHAPAELEGLSVILRKMDRRAVRLEVSVRVAVDGQARQQAALLHPDVRGRRERPSRRNGAVPVKARLKSAVHGTARTVREVKREGCGVFPRRRPRLTLPARIDDSRREGNIQVAKGQSAAAKRRNLFRARRRNERTGC